MKEEEVNVKKTQYTCDFCQKKSFQRWEISACEENHKQENCKHEGKDYSFNGRFIEVHCKNCNLKIDVVSIYTNSSEKIEKIYNILVE